MGLADMIDRRLLPEKMRGLYQDYRIHLIDMRRISEEALLDMNSDLKYVLGLMKCADSQDKYREYIREHQEFFRKVSRSAMDVLRVLLNVGKMKRLLEYTKPEDAQEEETDMCKALEMIENEARMQGVKQAIRALVETCAELGVSKEMTVERVVAKTTLSRKDATKCVNQYWC